MGSDRPGTEEKSSNRTTPARSSTQSYPPLQDPQTTANGGHSGHAPSPARTSSRLRPASYPEDNVSGQVRRNSGLAGHWTRGYHRKAAKTEIGPGDAERQFFPFTDAGHALHKYRHLPQHAPLTLNSAPSSTRFPEPHIIKSSQESKNDFCSIRYQSRQCATVHRPSHPRGQSHFIPERVQTQSHRRLGLHPLRRPRPLRSAPQSRHRRARTPQRSRQIRRPPNRRRPVAPPRTPKKGRRAHRLLGPALH